MLWIVNVNIDVRVSRSACYMRVYDGNKYDIDCSVTANETGAVFAWLNHICLFHILL